MGFNLLDTLRNLRFDLFVLLLQLLNSAKQPSILVPQFHLIEIEQLHGIQPLHAHLHRL
jgi:hypothetical protein